MPKRPMPSLVVDYGLILALGAAAAIAASGASYLAVAGLCFAGSLACFRRLGRLVEVRVHAATGSRG